MNNIHNLIIDVDEFLDNSINSNNLDKITIPNNKNLKDLLGTTFPTESSSINITLNSLTYHYNLLKGEYLMTIIHGMILTNKRVFLHLPRDNRISIPLSNIISYNIDKDKAILQFSFLDAEEAFVLNRWIKQSIVINAVENHKNDIDFKNDDLVKIIWTLKKDFF
ncbi:hypothetical protein SAMN05216490_1927 [Mucilaginibacter mallensis]|uniref:Uncharacterized protein n=1 Tax=Mucilaginibacter mallensis TaxID=652787 RepID=A0A1H1VJ29_MUCMA|nr:hypothetical protein [Mucilaginibacter mallensis]SDS84351.1 hypothetical protein SAMN05216490_1927 [Mucilaginibacter mallensis]